MDVAQQLLERNMGRVPNLRTAFLDFLRRNPDKLGSSAEQRRHRIRLLAKALNLRGGVTLLDCLSEGDIDAFLTAELALLA